MQCISITDLSFIELDIDDTALLQDTIAQHSSLVCTCPDKKKVPVFNGIAYRQLHLERYKSSQMTQGTSYLLSKQALHEQLCSVVFS